MAENDPIVIEKGVSISAYKRKGPTETKYPFKIMEIGDSFEVKLSDSRSTTLLRLQNTLIQCAKAAIGPGKIATRKLDDDSGFRVWRIA